MLLSVCLKGFSVVKYKRLNCRISDRISIFSIRSYIKLSGITEYWYPTQSYFKLHLKNYFFQSVLLGDVCYVLGGSGSSSVPTNAVEYLDLSLPVLQGVGEDGVGREWKQVSVWYFFFIAQSLNICYSNNTWVSTENDVMCILALFYLSTRILQESCSTNRNIWFF